MDVDDRQLMRARSWRWLEGLIVGLFDKPRSRLSLKIYPPQQQPAADDDEGGERWH